MKRLTDYIAEEIYAVENPVPGDHFDIEVDTDTIIETDELKRRLGWTP